MEHHGKRNCLFCEILFRPDPRNERHQQYCTKPECRKASKAASQRAWLAKPENQGHFRGPDNVARVQEWRAANPGYWRRPKGQRGAASEEPIAATEPSVALQDVCNVQPVEINKDSKDTLQLALQDILFDQPAVLIGFIAKFTGCTLQDEISESFRNLVKLGHDILAGGISDDHQARALSGTDSACSGSIQLGGSPSGSRAVHPAL